MRHSEAVWCDSKTIDLLIIFIVVAI